jgi:hypothetical protein
MILVLSMTAKGQLINQQDKYFLNCDGTNFTLNLDGDFIDNNDVSYFDHFGLDASIVGSHVFHPGAPPQQPYIDFWDVVIDNYKGYGWIEFYIDGLGQHFKVYFIECCMDLPSGTLISIDDDLSNLPNFPTFSNETFLLMGDNTLDATMFISGSECFFGTDSKIQLNQFADLSISDQSKLQPYCDYYWDGIFGEWNSTKLTVNESKIIGAARGLTLSRNVEFSFKQNQINNCYTGLHFTNYTNSGPFYDDSFMEIIGNQFVFPFNSSYQIHQLSPLENIVSTISWGNWWPGQYCHIFVDECDFVQVGEPTGTSDENYFSGRNSISILVYGSNFKLENNVFEDVGTALFGIESSLRIGGPTNNHGNYFHDGQVVLELSNQYLGNNRFYDQDYLVRILDPNNDPIFPTSLFSSTHNGTHVIDNLFVNRALSIQGDNSPVELIIEDNRFISNENNTFSLVSLQLKDLIAGDDLLITNNRFQNAHILNSTNQTSQVVFDNAHHVIFSENTINWAPSINLNSTLDFVVNGLALKNAQNTTITNNYFYQRRTAIWCEGDVTGMVLECNHFQHNFNAIYFHNVTAASHFGSSGAPVLNWFDHDPNHMITPIYSLNGNSPGFSPIDYFFPIQPSIYNPNQLPDIMVSTNSPIQDQFSSSSGSSCGNFKSEGAFSDYISNLIITVYPNPFNESIYVNSSLENIQLRLLDLSGRVLANIQGSSMHNLSSLSSGVYFIEIRQDGMVLKREKLVKK